MSGPSWRERVADMLKAVDEVLSFVQGMERDAFLADRRTVVAVAFEIGVIGEAVTALPEDLRERHPEIPWRLVRSMRNRVIHQYWLLDEEILWDTIHDDLPPFRTALVRLLAEEGQA